MNVSRPKFHTLDIEYNDHGRFTAVALEGEFFSVDLTSGLQNLFEQGKINSTARRILIRFAGLDKYWL